MNNIFYEDIKEEFESFALLIKGFIAKSARYNKAWTIGFNCIMENRGNSYELYIDKEKKRKVLLTTSSHYELIAAMKLVSLLIQEGIF